MFAQARHRGNQDLGRKIRHDGHRRRFEQHRERAVGDRLRRVFEPVLDAAAHREECAAGMRAASVLRQVRHGHIARQVGESGEQPRETVGGGRSHRIATLFTTGSLTGASGGTASRRNAPPTTPENTGAATSPP